MLQSRVRIKAFDVSASKWFDAPIMQTTSRRSNMTDWKARVSSGPLPPFPKEDSSSVPIVCATVQRVDIQGLCEIVKNAADRAFVKYDASRTLAVRENIKCRGFPDRCYLTRTEQLDRTRPKHGVSSGIAFLRFHHYYVGYRPKQCALPLASGHVAGVSGSRRQGAHPAAE
jgi:hypothetical protein